MGLFGRTKRDSEKTSDEIDKKTHLEKGNLTEEMSNLQKEIQEAAVLLESHSHELEKRKAALDAVNLELKTAQEELEFATKDIHSIRLERETILNQIKPTNEESALTKSAQIELEQVKQQISDARDELSKINSEKELVNSELVEMQSQLPGIREEFEKMKSEKEFINSELAELRSQLSVTREEFEKILFSKEHEEKEIEALKIQHEIKKKDILVSKKELEFIETELATIGRSDSVKKIVAAAGAVAAAINAKYESTKKELEIIKIAHTRIKEELETVKKELELQGKNTQFSGK